MQHPRRLTCPVLVALLALLLPAVAGAQQNGEDPTMVVTLLETGRSIASPTAAVDVCHVIGCAGMAEDTRLWLGSGLCGCAMPGLDGSCPEDLEDPLQGPCDPTQCEGDGLELQACVSAFGGAILNVTIAVTYGYQAALVDTPTPAIFLGLGASQAPVAPAPQAQWHTGLPGSGSTAFTFQFSQAGQYPFQATIIDGAHKPPFYGTSLYAPPAGGVPKGNLGEGETENGYLVVSHFVASNTWAVVLYLEQPNGTFEPMDAPSCS